MNRKLLLTATFMLVLSGLHFLRAGEGMWLPILLQQMNEKEMQSMGFKLTADDIYSINHSSMKDGIVLFGGGCTAEFVSKQGLLLTNHHCGYGRIQAHSSLEHDYLTDGFWAKSLEEELPNPGLTVTLLVRMEDVTAKVLAGLQTGMDEVSRDSLIQANSEKLIKEAEKETHYKAMIKSFYAGNEFYLFVNEIFKDVRLVGAPPSNIGKFGGDTDNWMWPRHTGDFSVFRVYVGKDGKPAEYSKDNVPYVPKYAFNVSLDGYKEGDFTFVFGYPGTTQEYLSSPAIRQIVETENPVRIKIRTQRLSVIDQYMEQSRKVRIQYSAKAAGIANGWKKWIGESKGLRKLDALDKKQAFEAEFQAWTAGSPERQQKYGKLLTSFDDIYRKSMPLVSASVYYSEAGMGVEILRFSRQFANLVKLSMDSKTKAEDLTKALTGVKKGAADFFKNYHKPLDMELAPWLLREYATNTSGTYQPAALSRIQKKYRSDYNAFTRELFEDSFLDDEEKLMKFLENYTAGDYRKLVKDPVYRLAQDFYTHMVTAIQPQLSGYQDQTDSLQRLYMQAQREMQTQKRFYPDANLTLRITYGQVKPYFPMDGVKYQYSSTIEGILQKEDTAVYDYVVDPRLKALALSKDFGQYAAAPGRLNTCFIATNHTTGGNSGSPVLNARGELIGINFDRCWEGTMSDLMYDPDQCRNISLDIRYCLFVIDKVCGAGHLVREMNLVKGNP